MSHDQEPSMSAYDEACAELAARNAEAESGWRRAAAEHSQAPRIEDGQPRVRVVAEGDSWFDYPGNDIADCLDDRGYDVRCIAKRGHLIEDIAHTQLADLVRAIGKHKPRFLLLSGGGNDIAGSELAMLINHRDSRLANAGDRLRPNVVRYIFDQVFLDSFRRIIETATQAAEIDGGSFDIVGHGYDYPFADGRPAFWFFGPWLKPPLTRRGYEDARERRAIMRDLMDEMNALQVKLQKEYVNYHAIDFRGNLPSQADWANELHPTQKQFGYLAQRFGARMQQLL